MSAEVGAFLASWRSLAESAVPDRSAGTVDVECHAGQTVPVGADRAILNVLDAGRPVKDEPGRARNGHAFGTVPQLAG